MPKNKIYIALILLGLGVGILFGIYHQNKPSDSLANVNLQQEKSPSLRPFWRSLGLLPGENLEAWEKRQKQENGGIFDFFHQQILQTDAASTYALWQNPGVDSLTRDVDAFWTSNDPDVVEAQHQLNKVLGRYRSLIQSAAGIPSDSLPKIPTPVGMISLFQYQCVLSDSNLWVGLDLFMKENYRYYPTVEQLYLYQRRRTHPRHLPVAIARTLSEDLVDTYQPGPLGGKLLDRVLREGRIMTCLRWLLPETPDSLLLGYQPDQWQWIVENENQVWKQIVSQNVLFSEDPLLTSRYLSDGPFTSGLAPNSPPALGRYFGDRIVQKWLSQQKQIKGWLQQKNNPETLLQESGYRGRS
jgi:hypothetical protein